MKTDLRLLLKCFGGICLGLLAAQVMAQEPISFRHLDSRQGLSQNSVNAIVQDTEGFMWFGTRSGLNRYDGYRMRTYKQADGDPSGPGHSSIDALYVDPATQKLWVGTENNLSLYDPTTDAFRTFTFWATGSGDSVLHLPNAVLRDSQGFLWVGTSGGLYRLRGQDTTFIPCMGPPEGSSEDVFRVFALQEDPQGRIWLGTNTGIYQLMPDAEGRPTYRRARADAAQAGLLHGRVELLEVDEQGYLWLGNRQDGLLRWRMGEAPKAYQHEPDDPGSLSDNDLRAIEVGPQGHIWVGTFKGLSILDPATGRFQHHFQEAGNPYSLGNGSVRAICFDARGSAWIGTYYSGVSYYNPEAYRFTHYQPGGGEKDLSHAVVSAFWEDEQANLWVGTEGGGINYWNRAAGTFTHYATDRADGLSGNNVKTLLGSGDSLWIGTFGAGLDLLHIKENRWEHFYRSPQNSLTHNNVYALWQTGHELWIGTFGGGLNRLDLKTGRFSSLRHDPQLPASLCSDRVRVLLQDAQKRMWVGTAGGLDRVEVQAAGTVEVVHFLPGKYICSLLLADDGSIWVGTYRHGVVVLGADGQQRAHYTTADGLPAENGMSLLQDRAGRIWVSSEKGLAKIDRRDGSVTSYNYSDGLENLEYNFNAAYQTQSSEMFFGGTQGFTAFFPQAIRTNTFVPPLAFTHLLASNELVRPGDQSGLLDRSINETQHLVFPYNEANFSLGFAALDYLNPANNHYAYQLEGIDQDWQRVQGQAEVNYILQRSGEYLFRLKAGNNDDIWNPLERQLKITVQPPPWRSPWAYAVYASLLFLLLVGGYRFIQMRHRLQLDQHTLTQQAELHQAKLRFYTNVTHEFRTPLTLILGPVEELLRQGSQGQGERQLQAIEQNARRLLRLVNQLLNFRSLEHDHGQLQAAPGNLVNFLREVYLSFQEQARLARLDYRFESSAERLDCWFDRDKMEKVFYNLLSNAFKFTPTGGRVSLQIKALPDRVQVEVRDSGSGIPEADQSQIFERFYHRDPADSSAQVGTGIGLNLSKQLVELHAGTLELIDTQQTGTCFRVSLLKGTAHLAPEHRLADFKDSEDMGAYLEKAAQETLTAKDQPWAALNQEGNTMLTILLVEDNPEVRGYVKEIFAGHFEVIEAKDGLAGLKMAQDLLPDLVISDVMMPEMDGISLCSALKSQVETSHIPVILLTARTGQIFRVEGLETGADLYLTKPFSPYELELQVRNLLEARQRIRDRFHSVLKLEPREITLTSADHAFLTQAIEVVEQYMAAPDFTVEVFAQEMAVSRALIFTKLKALTSQTPNNFVKALRLKRSAQLLRQSDLGIAEVAYQVGFRDARYFSKCFQKEFGQVPSEYRACREV